VLNVPHVNKTVTDFGGGIYTNISPVATPLFSTTAWISLTVRLRRDFLQGINVSNPRKKSWHSRV